MIDPIVIALWQEGIAGRVPWRCVSVYLSSYIAECTPALKGQALRDYSAVAALAWDHAYTY